MQLVYMYMESPVGALKLVAHDQALVAVMWDNEDHKRVRLAELIENIQHPMLLKVKQQLEQYFAGQRSSLICHWIFRVQIFSNGYGELY